MTSTTRLERLARSPLAWVGAVLVIGAVALLGMNLSSGTPAPSPTVPPPAAEDIEPSLDLILFWGQECSNCEAEQEWLETVAIDYPDLTIRQYEIRDNKANADLFLAYGERFDFPALNWPVTVIGERVWIGWTPSIKDDMTEAIELAVQGEYPRPGQYGTGTGVCSEEDPYCIPEDEPIDVPFFGKVSLEDKSLIVSTLIIGFVDGVNPCSLWVISVLLTIVIRTASRRRVIAVGSTFLIVTTAMYALYMAAIYSALSVARFIGPIQIIVGLVAAVFGLVSVKDYFAFKKGLSFTISDSAKPGIYKRMREAAGHHSLVAALAATVALGVVVSIIETPCSIGLPFVWTGILRKEGVGAVAVAFLFLVYMIPFLLDEMIVFIVAVVTMRATKMQEKHGEILKLVGGVTMLALAAVLLFAPSLMEDPLKVLLLFSAAFALTAAIHLVTTTIRKNRELVRAED